MSLPKILTPHQVVEIEGEEFDLRALTRSEVALFQKQAESKWTMAELECAVIAAATDTPKDEVSEWYETTSTHVVEQLILAIREMSRMTEGAQKSG